MPLRGADEARIAGGTATPTWTDRRHVIARNTAGFMRISFLGRERPLGRMLRAMNLREFTG
jgi:hypothetical protein